MMRFVHTSFTITSRHGVDFKTFIWIFWGCCIATAAYSVEGIESGKVQEIIRWIERGQFGVAEKSARLLIQQVQQREIRQNEMRQNEADHRMNSLNVAMVQNLLVDALCGLGRAVEDEARRYADQALETRRRQLGVNHPLVAESLHSSACIPWQKGDYEGAKLLLEESLKIRRDTLEGHDPKIASNLNDLAILKRQTGDFEGADQDYREALAIQEAIPDHPRLGQTLTNLAVLVRTRGDYAEARKLFERALSVYQEQEGDHPFVAATLNSLAQLLVKTGDYAKARQFHEKALAMKRQIFGERSPQVAASLNNLALLLQTIRNHEGARRLHQEALGIWEEVSGPEHPHVATSLNNYASILKRQGRFEEARGMFERSLNIREKSLSRDHPMVGQTLHNLAGVLEALGEPENARSHYEKALKIRGVALGSDHPETAQTLLMLAALRFEMGAWDLAREMYSEAFSIFESTLGPQHPEVAAALNGLALVLQALGEEEAALAAAARGEAISREHAILTLRSLPAEPALRHAIRRSRGTNVLLALARQGASGADLEAWNALARGRALVLDELAERQRASVPIQPDEEQLQSAYRRLANLSVRGPGKSYEVYRTLLGEALERVEKLERRRAGASARFRGGQQRADIDLSTIAAALPPDAILISYALFHFDGPRYLAFVVRAGEAEPQVIDLGLAKEVEARVQAWLDQVTRFSERRYRRAGEELRQAIWDPVSSVLDGIQEKGIQQFFIVPDGEISRVSFAVLPRSSGGYLVEDPAVFHYLSAERDLLNPSVVRPRSTTTQDGAVDLLALGGARFGIPTRKDLSLLQASRLHRTCGLSSLQFEALPATETEVREVADLWEQAGRGGTTRLIAEEATEGEFKKQAGSHQALHLATHGFLLDRCRAPEESGIPDEEQAQPVVENALLLSGFALAGANRRGWTAHDEDDGILTAQEIAALDLSKVEWAVLSACGTGTGPLATGEGILGLRRAFRRAGVRSLITSLWKIDDEASHRFMRSLYRARFVEGLDVPQAVRQASLESLRDRAERGLGTHPFTWGAFIAEGAWR